jgi:Protein of unknown function (DUF1552)
MPFRPMNRRTFLRASGVAIGLPLLDAMMPTFASAAQRAQEAPRRMVLVGRPLGMYAPNFFPEQAGANYQPSRYLRALQPHKEQFTVISGMSHRYPAGHFAESALFTGVHPDHVRPSDLRNSISLDQEVASHVGGQTRFACLNLGGGDLIWNRRGSRVPSQPRATQVFRQLFIRGTADEEAREMRRIQEGRSILDDVRGQVQAMNTRLSDADRRRLDAYLASIREAEQRLQQDERWSRTPKPRVDFPPPTSELGGAQLVARSQQWFDIIFLALQNDSTRVVTLHLGSQDQTGVTNVTLAHHDASHHGQEPGKLDQLALIEEAEIRVFGEFLRKLKESREGEHTLLGRTVVLYTSNLGNSSSHDNTNLPILLAGGGFRHRGHLGFDRRNNTLLSNLYLRMVHQMGIEARSFGASTGVLSDV